MNISQLVAKNGGGGGGGGGGTPSDIDGGGGGGGGGGGPFPVIGGTSAVVEAVSVCGRVSFSTIDDSKTS
jgi:hypothetical protein